MKYEIIRNGNKIGGGEYDAQNVREIIQRHGGDPNLVPRHLTSAVKIATITIKPVREIKPNLGLGQQHALESRTEETGHIVYTYKVVDIPADSIKSALKRRLSAIHDEYEAARFEHEGVMIKADTEAKINSKAMWDEFEAGNVTATEWRGREPGDELSVGDTAVATIPVTDAATAEGIYRAIVAYVTKGFEARGVVEAEINAASDEDIKSYDVLGRFTAVATA